MFFVPGAKAVCSAVAVIWNVSNHLPAVYARVHVKDLKRLAIYQHARPCGFIYNSRSLASLNLGRQTRATAGAQT